MVLTAYFALSPVIGLFCHRRPQEACFSQNLTPASRRQDHTTSPSASQAPLVKCAARVHRIPPRVRDDRDTPLVWDETAEVIEVIWVRMESEYFCKWGWTGGANHVERLNKLPRPRVGPRRIRPDPETSAIARRLSARQDFPPTKSGLLSATCDRSAMSSKANGMSTLEIDVGEIRPVSVTFAADELVVDAGGIGTGRRMRDQAAQFVSATDGRRACAARERCRADCRCARFAGRISTRTRNCRDADLADVAPACDTAGRDLPPAGLRGSSRVVPVLVAGNRRSRPRQSRGVYAISRRLRTLPVAFEQVSPCRILNGFFDTDDRRRRA